MTISCRSQSAPCRCVHAALEGQGGEGVPEIVQPEGLQTGVLQNFLVELYHRVRVIHPARLGGGEQVGGVRMPAVLLDEQLDRLPRDGDPAHGGGGLPPP